MVDKKVVGITRQYKTDHTIENDLVMIFFFLQATE